MLRFRGPAEARRFSKYSAGAAFRRSLSAGGRSLLASGLLLLVVTSLCAGFSGWDGVALAGVLGEETSCVGDCDGDGRVGIEELIRGVNIALRHVDLEACSALDRNGDGQVGINELVTAVANALDGCPCPFDFHDERAGAGSACTFSGRWSSICGDATLPAVFSVQPGIVGVAVVTGPETPLLSFFAQPSGPRAANVVGFTFGEAAVQIGGSIELSDDGRRLTIAPEAEIGISIRDCPFDRYEGTFARVVVTGDAQSAP